MNNKYLKTLLKLTIATLALGGIGAATTTTLVSCGEQQTISVTGVTLDKNTLALDVGASATLKATVAPETASNKNVTWSSSDATVASVDETGKVTAVKAGTATITVTTKDGSKTATCAVTVIEPIVHVTSISLSESSISVNIGETSTLTATVLPENATDKSYVWSSSNQVCATVVDGVVTGVEVGTCTITVTTVDGNKIATCEVTVKESKSQLSALYNNVCDSALDKLGIDLNAQANPSSKNLSSLPIDGTALTDTTSTPYKATRGNLGSSICYIGLLGDLYKRDEVAVTDKPLKFTEYNSTYGCDVTYYILTTVDKDNNKIYSETILQGTSSGNDIDEYLNFDIDYDFAAGKVTAYHLGVYLIMGSSITYQNQAIDKDDKYYCAMDNTPGYDQVSDAFKTQLVEKRNEYKTKIGDVVIPSGDFQTEFDAFATKGNKAFQEAMK